MKRGLLFSLAVAAVIFASVSTAGAAKHDPNCSVSPSSVGSGQSYTVTAIGLPGRNANLVVTAPDGATMTSAVNPSGGTSSATYTAPSWNGETGTYTYTFVGKVSWPLGTFNTTYATCSVQVA